MGDLFYTFNAGTLTSRCPMPTKFAHLLQFVPRVENFIALHTQESITNINQQLDSTVNLMVSNIIQRVIAQVIGHTSSGFITIKGTDDGALHVSVRDALAAEKTPLKATINILGAATHDIIGAVAGKKHKISFIMFTVAGDTDVSFRDETGLLSGAMPFGGVDEPRGMVGNHGTNPLVCTVGEKFQIVSSAAIQISGYLLYYDEA